MQRAVLDSEDAAVQIMRGAGSGAVGVVAEGGALVRTVDLRHPATAQIVFRGRFTPLRIDGRHAIPPMAS